VGALLAAEARRKGVDVVLAPTLNLHRSPLGGRHFECFSEDPLLTGRIGAAYVRGLQAHGVGATPKHYVANDAETERFTADVRVDERTLREVYLAPFEQAVVEGRAWLVMAAYNAVNGVTMTEHPLLAAPLAAEWGFDGVVVSDWTAARSTEPAARAALDLVMPGPDGPWGAALVAAVRAGRVPEAAVDEKVRRLLRLATRVGALDGVPPPAPAPPWPGDAAAVVRAAAAAGMVLARNEGDALPLAAGGLSRVAVVGPNAVEARIQGGGSAEVTPPGVVSPFDGLRAALGPGVEVVHAVGARTREGLQPLPLEQVTDPESGAAGLRARFLDDGGAVLRTEHRRSSRLIWLGGEVPAGAAVLEVATRFRAAAGGVHRLGVAAGGPTRLVAGVSVLVDEAIVPDSGDPASLFHPPERHGELRLGEGEEVDLLVRHKPGARHASVRLGVEPPARPDDEELARAVALARDADAAVVVVGTTERIESEGFDRASLALPGRQDDLVRAVAAANPRTIAVVNAGGPVELPWRDAVPAVLLAWFPGQEFGAALADVLLGAREPGGRLPTSWGARAADVPVLDTRPVDGALTYAEGLDIGYRAWARAGVAPAYPFGHGLGYTTWSYEAVSVPPEVAAWAGAEVRVRVRNTGGRPGREVVQAYLSCDHSAVARPALWLAGWTAVEAGPGEERRAAIALAPRAFTHWTGEGWGTEPGAFTLRVGRSAADLPLGATLNVVA
jgi:beta-glucosidase